MPELPEIQALAERLDQALSGAALEGIVPLQFSALKTHDPQPESLLGRAVEGVGRRGKYLVLAFAGPRLAIHLSQGGRVTVEDPPKRTRPRGGVLRLGFAGRPAVLVKEFGTERRTGWWVLGPEDDGPLAGLGPEPSSEAFAGLVRESDDRRRLHTMLRDQRTVAGIGRGYADDILHRTRLSPFASLGSLGAEEREALLSAAGRSSGRPWRSSGGAPAGCRPSSETTSRSTTATGSPVPGAARTSGASPTSPTRSPTAPGARPGGGSWPTAACRASSAEK